MLFITPAFAPEFFAFGEGPTEDLPATFPPSTAPCNDTTRVCGPADDLLTKGGLQVFAKQLDDSPKLLELVNDAVELTIFAPRDSALLEEGGVSLELGETATEVYLVPKFLDFDQLRIEAEL